MIRALFRQLLAENREYRLQHQLHMDTRRLATIRRQLAGIDELRADLVQAEDEAVLDLIESARLVNELIENSAPAANNEMRKA